MNAPVRRSTRVIARVVAFALAGGLAALGVGLVAVALAPDNGFGDLAAAAVTLVFLVPAGLIVGAFLGWWTSRRRARAS